MKKDKLKLYALEILLIIFLIYTLFSAKLLNNRYEIAILLCIYAIVLKFLIKKPIQLNIKKKQATKTIIITAILYISIYYMVGIYTGYYDALHKFSLLTLGKYIIPITIIIVTSEYVRHKFITNDLKISNLLSFIIFVLIDISIYYNLYGLSTLDDFMLSVGYLLFASIACNLLYNYISRRFGIKPIIIYRLITTLYIYIIPITPDVFIFFKSLFRMIYPLLIYYILEDSYGENEEPLEIKKNIGTWIFEVICFIIMAIYAMLISCQFKYCALVIGSGSMTGTINKGDVIIYDSKIKIETIKVGDIIIFDRNGTKIVHRVDSIGYINNQKIYYTKGDNNKEIDEGYVTRKNIYGRYNLKISRIGKPTLWLHEMFEKKEDERGG